jgi:hypothetical protein
MNTSSQTPADKAFFNLHVTGIGYLSRIRQVDGGKRKGGSSRRGDSFLCCAINALHGSKDDPNYSYFDLKVAGGEATEIVNQLKEHVDADAKVLVAFKLGDIYPHSYQRPERDEKGRPTGRTETASLITGRLLLITLAKVNGEVVYQRKEDEPAGELERGTPTEEAPTGGSEGFGDDGFSQEPPPRHSQAQFEGRHRDAHSDRSNDRQPAHH